MRELAKLGFNQSYTYFTWKNSRWELTEYVTELAYGRAGSTSGRTSSPTRPDILTSTSSTAAGRRSRRGWCSPPRSRPSYGIYSGFEHCENVPLRAGSEEYLDSEKYELKPRPPRRPAAAAGRAAERDPTREPGAAAALERDVPRHRKRRADRLRQAARGEIRSSDRGQHRLPAGSGGPGRRTRAISACPSLRRRATCSTASGTSGARAANYVRLEPGARVAARDAGGGTGDRHGPGDQRAPATGSSPTRCGSRRAVFYEIHVRGFADANADGSGDFRGLTEKLDYLQWLGIDCIWLLPMYASPLRDGGYDISDFYSRSIPTTGPSTTSATFVDAAHQRGMRVIADLVMNHTSVDHPWFQESRSSPDSPKRDWYVWSDTDDRYTDARIIFVDTETSNWTWDPVAGAYYWHRFFSHQPDLNYDNPEVQKAMLDVIALLARPRARRLPPRRRALPLRAGRHELREPPRDPRLPANGSAQGSTSTIPTGCCWPRPTSGPRTWSSTSAMATSATWRSTSRSCPGCSWRCAARRRSPILEILDRTPPIPRQLPVGPVPAQPRRADARDGHRRRARLHVRRVRRRTRA